VENSFVKLISDVVERERNAEQVGRRKEECCSMSEEIQIALCTSYPAAFLQKVVFTHFFTTINNTDETTTSMRDVRMYRYTAFS